MAFYPGGFLSGGLLSVAFCTVALCPGGLLSGRQIRVEQGHSSQRKTCNISEMEQDIGPMLLLMTNRKSHIYALSIGAKINDLG